MSYTITEWKVTENADVAITILKEYGNRVTINIPLMFFQEGDNLGPYGLNLVFGRGCHYE